MAAIPNLSLVTIQQRGGSNYAKRESVQVYSKHKSVDAASGVIKVEARCVAQSTNQGFYDVVIEARNTGVIISSSCTCPMGSLCCKHCCAVLVIAATTTIDQNPAFIQRNAKRQRTADLLRQNVKVYIALKSMSEWDSGSDYNMSRYVRENFDTEILGVFFKLKAANKRAKEAASELGFGDEEEEEEEEEAEDEAKEEEDDEDEEMFSWSNEDQMDEDYFDRVWVEERPLEDASPQFHI
jgi:uncharacterized Zn finger protein